MKIPYKNNNLEKVIIWINFTVASIVAATFILLYGFDEIPLALSVGSLHIVQIIAFLIFVCEKVIRFVNASSKIVYLKAYWFEIPLLLLLIATVFSAQNIEPQDQQGQIIMLALAIYLVFQVIVKLCRNTVNLAASGQNPTLSLIAMFVVLIMVGAGLLTLPKAHNLESMSFTDALFTATSATCVTGLIVKDTGTDFTLMGQVVILTLIQLGGLGIVIFGAILALLLGQALSVRESVAMQDLLNAQTLGRIGNIIGFIFITTLIIESIGAISMVHVWNNIPGNMTQTNANWFCSIFHSISAFCNAGFSLFDSSMIDYQSSWALYAVISPLIILGGLGFGVLYNIFQVTCDKIIRFFQSITRSGDIFHKAPPRKIQLQTKIVIVTTLILIIAGAAAISLFEHYSPSEDHDSRLKSALFQSITARTAGFNSIDIAAMSQAGKLVLIILMFIGGSPGSTAGGIKTVTFTVIIMTVYASIRKRPHVEIFKRSVRPAVVGRAVTVVMLFIAVLITSTFVLSITERRSNFDFNDILFESASALGTVGLTTGITPSLTTLGKLIIIAEMLIGRLGPLTLLAAVTFNLKPAVFEYPSEPIMVG